jgi:hypothetical protein
MSTSLPRMVPGSIWWSGGSPNSPTSEFDAACSEA